MIGQEPDGGYHLSQSTEHFMFKQPVHNGVPGVAAAAAEPAFGDEELLVRPPAPAWQPARPFGAAPGSPSLTPSRSSGPSSARSHATAPIA